MKQIILSIAILVSVFKLHAQEKLNYQLNGKNIEFTISKEKMYVEFKPTQKTSIQQTGKDRLKKLTDSSAILKMTDLKGTYQERKRSLKNKISNGFQRIEPVLIYKDGTQQIAKGEFNIKLKANASLNNVLKGIDFRSESNDFDKSLYLVKVGLETSELFKLVKQLQKDNEVEFVEPNFIRMIQSHTSDPFFLSQWAINNQGYLGGTVDADMDVDDSWLYAMGTGIKIAIIDEGVDLSHPDLTSNLLPGYDATGGSSNGAPNEITNDGHGTACAGIVAAIRDNNIGITGIAYNSKIIPVRIAYTNGYPLGDSRRRWIADDNWIANGINWAWQNGADVLSNSWGGGSYSSTISNSINNAVNNGRNGKGAVVLFSSGNNNSAVSFPATLDNVIAVGASSMCDERKTPSSCDGETWWGSNYGEEIDIIAPGVKIYTTDISGSSGYNPGDYKSDFNGTSSACPNAAGVVALMLSINPDLTKNEVKDIIESTCTKVGSYDYAPTSGRYNGTWDDEVGYGLVNAHQAVLAALPNIAGSDVVCSFSSTFNLSYLPPNTTVSWSSSSNISFPSGNTGSSVSAQASSSTVSGNGWIEATLTSSNGSFTLPRKDVWVGRTKVPNYSVVSKQVTGLTDPISLGDCDDIAIKLNIQPENYEHVIWDKVSSNYTISEKGNQYAILAPFSNGDLKLRVQVRNQCGLSNWIYHNVDNTCDSGGPFYSVYPNPANQYTELNFYNENQLSIYQKDSPTMISISLSEQTQELGEYEIQIWSERKGLVKKLKSRDKKLQIKTNNLDEGLYFLHVIVNGRVYKQKLKIER